MLDMKRLWLQLILVSLKRQIVSQHCCELDSVLGWCFGLTSDKSTTNQVRMLVDTDQRIDSGNQERLARLRYGMYCIRTSPLSHRQL